MCEFYTNSLIVSEYFCAFLKTDLVYIDPWPQDKITKSFAAINQWIAKKTGGAEFYRVVKGPPIFEIHKNYAITLQCDILNSLPLQSSHRDTLWLFFNENFLSSFPHILTPNLWRPGVRFWSYVTFCTCTSDRKWLQNVILCTKSMQIEFFHIVHINMLIFTLNGWNEFVLALLCFKKCLPQISLKKTTKTKGQKTKKYIRNS